MTNPLMPLIEAMAKGRRYEGDGDARRIIRTLVGEVDRLQSALAARTPGIEVADLMKKLRQMDEWVLDCGCARHAREVADELECRERDADTQSRREQQ